MMLFYPLILAHVIGDFVLQPYWLVRLKERAHIGLVIHVSLVSLLGLIITFILTAMYGQPGYLPSLAAAVLVFITHYLIDLTKVRAPKPARARLIALILDQAAHIIVGASIAGYFPLIFKMPPAVSAAGRSAEVWLDIAALFLYATFAGAIFVFEAGNSLMGKIDGSLPMKPRVMGIIDRGIVALLMLFGLIWAAPVYIAARLVPAARITNRRFWIEQGFSYAMAVGLGLLMMPLRRW